MSSVCLALYFFLFCNTHALDTIVCWSVAIIVVVSLLHLLRCSTTRMEGD